MEQQHEISHSELFWGFNRIALSGFGGVMSWARRTMVEERGWLSSEEFTSLFGLCQFMPGPNIVNMSICVGGRFQGASGAVVSLLGLMGAPVIIIIALGALYGRFGELPAIQAMLRGVASVAAGLILATGLKMATDLLKQNALSSWLKCRIWREGKEHYIEFHNGNAVAPLKVVGDANGERGTEVSFLPSTETFHNVMEFDFATLEHRLRELAFLNSGAKIVLTDARHADIRREEFVYDGGTAAFVRYLDRSKSSALPDPIMIHGEKDGTTVEVAMEWTNSYHETMLCFTNNIPQRDGGTHLAGFRGALTRTSTTTPMRAGSPRRRRCRSPARTCARA